MKNLSLIFPLLAALSLCSCMTFEKDWEKSVSDYNSGKVSAPEGPWTGSWVTTSNGHRGDLRAIVTESEANPGEYDFRYHATWAKIFSGSYTVSYPAKRSGSRYLFDGKEKLGPFGTFGHRATISRNSFKATFSSDRDDLGEFLLSRPE